MSRQRSNISPHVITRFEGDELVGYWPGVSRPLARVHVPTLARRMGAPVSRRHMRKLQGYTEVGRFGDRLRKFVKRVVPARAQRLVHRVATTAQKVVHSKIFAGIAAALSVAVPQPGGALIGAGAALLSRTGNLVRAAKAGNLRSAANTALGLATKIAQGAAPLSDAKLQAPKLGIDYRDIKAAAAVKKVAIQAAGGNDAAKQVMAGMQTMLAARREADAGSAGPGLNAAAEKVNQLRAELAAKLNSIHFAPFGSGTHTAPPAAPAAPRAIVVRPPAEGVTRAPQPATPAPPPTGPESVRRRTDLEAEARKKYPGAFVYELKVDERPFRSIVVPA